jgi:choline dehydrogenase
MTYIRGDSAQFDAWEQLGNDGWNWDSLLPYFKKSEAYTIPTTSQQAAGATYEGRHHGFNGHVHVGYPSSLDRSSFASVVRETWEGLSLTENPDLNSGSVRGFSMGPQTIDTVQDVRWDSARAYLHPILDRPNIHITKGTVKRITWDDGVKKRTAKENELKASGVEYVDDRGTAHIVTAKKEVIISAGTVRSPLILEASGIGNPRILRSLGIETRIDLPSVGENLIEQPFQTIAYTVKGNLTGSSSAYHAFLTATDLFGEDLIKTKESVLTRLPIWAQTAVDASEGGLNLSAVETQFRLQHSLMFEKNVANAEVLHASPTGSAVVASNYWILLPFSRGSVHLVSMDDTDRPALDPRLFWADFDLDSDIALGQMARKFWRSEPALHHVGDSLVPRDDILPENADEGQWALFTKGFGELTWNN